MTVHSKVSLVSTYIDWLGPKIVGHVEWNLRKNKRQERVSLFVLSFLVPCILGFFFLVAYELFPSLYQSKSLIFLTLQFMLGIWILTTFLLAFVCVSML